MIPNRFRLHHIKSNGFGVREIASFVSGPSNTKLFFLFFCFFCFSVFFAIYENDSTSFWTLERVVVINKSNMLFDWIKLMNMFQWTPLNVFTFSQTITDSINQMITIIDNWWIWYCKRLREYKLNDDKNCTVQWIKKIPQRISISWVFLL